MVTLRSKAKLNLFLHVTGKCSDGYHLLDSMVMFTENLSDEIEIAESHLSKIDVIGMFSSKVVGENILRRVLDKFQEITVTPKFKITINKNIPVGAGMGGGSSNAACLINFLFKEYAPHITHKDIIKFGVSIGADVPAFLHSKQLYFGGIGEIISPIVQIPETYAVIVYPNISISTQEIFSGGFCMYKDKAEHPTKFLSHQDIWGYFSNLENDLFSNIKKDRNILVEIIESLKQEPECKVARMTGSGSACFGLFEIKKDAENASISLQNKFPFYSVYFTKLS